MEKLFPDTFIKNENWEYIWIDNIKFYAVGFCCIPSIQKVLKSIDYWQSKSVETKLQIACFHLKYKSFLKTKRGLVSLPHFLHEFLREMFVLLYFVNWPNMIFWLTVLRDIVGNMCIVTVNRVVALYILKLTLSF